MWRNPGRFIAQFLVLVVHPVRNLSLLGLRILRTEVERVLFVSVETSLEGIASGVNASGLLISREIRSRNSGHRMMGQCFWSGACAEVIYSYAHWDTLA